MIRHHPISTPTDPLFPYPTLFRSDWPTPTDETRADAIELFQTADEVFGNVHSAIHLGRRKYTLASKLEKENRMVGITRLYEEAERHIVDADGRLRRMAAERSEEHTSELQSLMRI